MMSSQFTHAEKRDCKTDGYHQRAEETRILEKEAITDNKAAQND